jgi:hypothetical protein
MRMLSKHVRYGLVLVLVFQCASCARNPHEGRQTCPVDSGFSGPTRLVQGKFAPIEFSLPANVEFRTLEFNDQLQRGEAWTGLESLVVTYSVQDEPLELREISWGDHNAVDCNEQIGGHPAMIHMLYSNATTAAGQRVLAVWKLPQGETLSLQAFHPDSSRRGELLSIIRSARFRTGLSGTPRD